MTYRKPTGSGTSERAHGVVARAAEPPPDVDASAASARREAGKLMAAKMAEDAREERKQERDLTLARWVAELVFALFR